MASLSTSESSGLPEPFIRQWREAVASKDQVDDHGIFQRYYEVCEKLFDALMEYCSHSSTVNEHHLKIINRSRKLFQLWGIETDIEKGEVDHRFLRGSNKDLKNLSLTLLTSIGDTLIHKLISYLTGNPEAVLSLPTSTAVEALREEARYHAADDGDCSDDNSSDTENESATLESTTEKIEDAVLHLQQCIEHLIYLIKPIQNNEPSNSGRQTAERRPQDLLADLVRIKLPKAHNDIIALLGELAWDVRQRKPNAKEQHKETVGEVSARPDDIRTLSNDLSRRDDSGLGSSLPTELLTEEPSRLRHSENRGHISSCGLNEEDKNWVMKLLIDRAAGRDSSRIPCPVCQKSLTKGRPKFLRHIADHIEEINFILSPASSRQCSDAGSSPADPSRPHFSDNLPAMGLGPESPTNRGEGNDLTGSMDPTAFFSVRRSSEEISGLRRGPFSQHQQYLDEPPLSPLLEYLEQHQTWSFDTANNNNNAAQQQLRGEDADALSGPPGLLEQRHKSANSVSSTERKRKPQYFCDFRPCDRKEPFKSSTDLKRHKKIHGEGLFIYWNCSECSSALARQKKWPRKDNFVTHVKTKHPNKEIEGVLESSKQESEEDPGLSTGDALMRNDQWLLSECLYDQESLGPVVGESGPW